MAAIIALLAATPAIAQSNRWLPIAWTAEHVVLLDTRTERVDRDGTRVVWLEMRFDEDRTDASGTVNSIKVQWRLNCQARTFTLLRSVGYERDGEVVYAHDFAAPATTEVVPGTTGEDQLDALCDRSSNARGGRMSHAVYLLGGRDEYAFRPDTVTAAIGDSLVVIHLDGGPHNVSIDVDSVPAEQAAAWRRVFAGTHAPIGPTTADYTVNRGERTVLSLAGVPPGIYTLRCDPHRAMGARLTIRVVATRPRATP